MERAHIDYTPRLYACHGGGAIRYEYVFRSSTTHALGTILRDCVVAHVALDWHRNTTM